LQFSDQPGHDHFSEAVEAAKTLSKNAHIENKQSLRSHLLNGDRQPPSSADLRRNVKVGWPVENQGTLQSCTAHAVVGLVKFLLRRQKSSGNAPLTEDLSRLFLYRASRRLVGWTGDTGSYLRTTIKAMVLFGIPPEEYWPYDPSRLDDEPDAFCFSYAANFKAAKYIRLDGYGAPTTDATELQHQAKVLKQLSKASAAGVNTLNLLRRALADGFPVAFGFPVYSSMTSSPEVPIPGDADRLLGGHAVLAVGYDDKHNGGAVLIRNSWGPDWGTGGYGWLPYRYVTDDLAVDFWTIFEQNWIDLSHFEDKKNNN
jgi:C1A family cysteine protease